MEAHDTSSERLRNEEHLPALLKVYGDGTNIIIDRNSQSHKSPSLPMFDTHHPSPNEKLGFRTKSMNAEEVVFHQILARHHLAAPLLFRFASGHAYRFVEGEACSASSIADPRVWPGVAAELARWHTLLPTPSVDIGTKSPLQQEHNVWATAKKWLEAVPLPTKQKEDLRLGFEYLVHRVLETDPPDQAPVLGHGDLLGANVIVQHDAQDGSDGTAARRAPGGNVKFIDYELRPAIHMDIK